MDDVVPIGKLSIPQAYIDGGGSEIEPHKMKYVVFVATGSFNPPTYMHLRMFELARDALLSEGYCVIGGYMSPVNDAYNKKGLVSAKHRLQMCDLASGTSDFVMVDPWEANQSTYQRTLTVLSRVKSSLAHGEGLQYLEGSFQVMLVCGSDLLESFVVPGVWIPEQMQAICRDYGVVCIRREGQDIERIICNNTILSQFKHNIKIVDDLIPNQISSSRVRKCISNGLSVKYLLPDSVINYIKENHLYLAQPDS
ncbi:hypothetical protein V2J09_020499 [Rumex salicifolius]